MRSVIPPWPGIESPKSLMLNVRFSPDAKKPPNGAISDANDDMTRMWNCIGDMSTLVGSWDQFGGMNGSWYVRGMKTGFGSHSSPVKMLAPKSLTGQMKYLYRMSTFVMKKPNMIVQIHAPMKPASDVSTTQHRSDHAKHTFHSLLRAELDELRAPECDADQVGEDVVRDDQADRQEKPDHPFEDVVHDEVRLHDDQIERHVRPRKLGELESIVTLLERADEEDEACFTISSRSRLNQPLEHEPIT